MPNKTKMEERRIPISLVTYFGTLIRYIRVKNYDFFIHNDVEQDVK